MAKKITIEYLTTRRLAFIISACMFLCVSIYLYIYMYERA